MGLLSCCVWIVLLCSSTVAPKEFPITPGQEQAATNPVEEYSIIPAITQFSLDSDKSIVMMSAKAEEGSSPTMRCSANKILTSWTIEVKRERDGVSLDKIVESNLEFPLGPLRCQDSGVYVCRVQNQEYSAFAKLELSVTCPPRLINHSLPSSLDSPFYNVSVGEDLTIRLDIMSSPPPTWISLTTLHTGDVLAFRDMANDSAWDHGRGQERFGFEYVPAVPPYGTVELSITGLAEEDVDRIFLLVVQNGEDKVLNYVFVVIQDSRVERVENAQILPTQEPNVSDPERPPNIPAIVLGMVLVAVALFILVIVACVAWRRGSRKGSMVADMDQVMEVRQQEKNGSVDSSPGDDCEDPPSMPRGSVLFDYTSRPRTLTGQVKQVEKQMKEQQQQQKQQEQQKQKEEIQQLEMRRRQQEKLQQSSDGDENFSKDYQPQDRLSRPHGSMSQSVESPYYVSDVEMIGKLVGPREEGEGDDVEDCEYSEFPRNTSLQIDEEEGKEQLHRMAARVQQDSDTGEQEQEPESVNERKSDSTEKLPELKSDTEAPAATAAVENSSLGSEGSESL